MKWLKRRKPVYERAVSGVCAPFHAYINSRIGLAHACNHSKWRNRRFHSASVYHGVVEMNRIIREGTRNAR